MYVHDDDGTPVNNVHVNSVYIDISYHVLDIYVTAVYAHDDDGTPVNKVPC